MEFIRDLEALEDIYDVPVPTSLSKVANQLTPMYRRWIAASSFCVVATAGPEGLDCSPRGDLEEVAVELDERTLAIPDRRGNNRIDSLRNIVADGRISLMFMVAGSNSVVRVNGSAKITVDADLVARFVTKGKAPRSVIIVQINEVYFQCAKALLRSGLWGPRSEISDLPTAGDFLKEMTNGQAGGASYDKAWPKRAEETLW